jgi:hypothetical protein
MDVPARIIPRLVGSDSLPPSLLLKFPGKEYFLLLKYEGRMVAS